ncbi:unnamed protein product [Miscanthus lutarioriparius]|uniref:Verticillium wilt resistance-like protein n=1 Tax=Miscanthus lutarioriparius TaxID=422564 RepID=A0A811NBN4_9POAL|nr:unnamed protein product [Miscanthus lutarioriparius]
MPQSWCARFVLQHQQQHQLPSTGFECLTKLTYLNLSTSSFSGPVPTASIASLTNLASIISTDCQVVDLYSDGYLLFVHRSSPSVRLTEKSLENLIHNLSNLRELHLGFVDLSSSSRTGWCDALVVSCPQLQVLSLPHCRLSGPICGSLSGLGSLSVINLDYDHLSGPFPHSFTSLTNLSVLQLRYNDLQGWIPPAIFQQKKLVTIDVYANLEVSGYLPDFSRGSCLENLNVGRTNFSGIIPGSISDLISLRKLGLGASGFSGELPTSIGNFKSLSELEISGMGVVGPMPSWVANLTSLTSLRFYECGLSGSIPSSLGDLSSHLSDVSLFMASGNNFSGEIPLSFCDGLSIQLLDLSYNGFNGSVPSCLMENVDGLESLYFKENKLNGVFPDNIKKGCSFVALDFSGNRIEGKLPRSLLACKNLEVLDIDGNSNCSFSSAIIIDLSSNNFSGPLPQGRWFQELKSMALTDANASLILQRILPNAGTAYAYKYSAAVTYKGHDTTFAKILKTLVFIDFSNNAFHGNIPEAIGELHLLHGLNISHNSLTGPIPPQLGHLIQLEALDLSFNELSGEIPQEIASLDFLTTLNLSNNKLVGSIPQSPHFLTFINSSFLGNDGLCGTPLSKRCINTTMTTSVVSHHSKKESVDVVLFLIAGLGFGAGFALAVVVAWAIPIRKRRS